MCERKIGELLIAMKERRELRQKGDRRSEKSKSSPATLISSEQTQSKPESSLAELGLTKDESSDAQALASDRISPFVKGTSKYAPNETRHAFRYQARLQPRKSAIDCCV